MAKPRTRFDATTLRNYGQGEGQKKGNYYSRGLQRRLKEDNSKKTKGWVAEAHRVLPVDSWRYRIHGVVEAGSSLDFRKVHERLQRVLRPRSKILRP
jgi:hypothetical protein